MRKLIAILIMIICISTLSNAQSFIENRGQFDEKVLAKHHNDKYDLWITSDALIFDFYQVEEPNNAKSKENYIDSKKNKTPKIRKGQIVRLEFAGANRDSKIIFSESTGSNSNYFINSKESIQTSEFAKAIIENIYPNIDLECLVENGNFRYNFIVNPNADPSLIKMKFEGQNELVLASSNIAKFSIDIAFASIEFRDIKAFQKNASGFRSFDDVPVNLYVLEDGVIGFDVSDYNKNEKLVIDPLVYASYLGGSGNDVINDIYVEHGFIYTVGTTFSTDFPTSTGAYSTSYDDLGDVVVSKFSRDGSGLIYSTYINGYLADEGLSIVVQDGIATIAGMTKSGDIIPASLQSGANTPYQNSLGGGEDGFIIKINEDASEMVYATYYGGTSNDRITKIKYDNDGNLIAVGKTYSDPTTKFMRLMSLGYQDENKGDSEGFISKFSSDAKYLLNSTFLGDTGLEELRDLVIDDDNNIYVIGYTDSDDIQTAGNPIQSSNQGMFAAIVAKLSPDLENLKYLTYFSGTDSFDVTEGNAIELDEEGNVYIAGFDWSYLYPSTSGVIMETDANATENGFIAKFKPGNSTLIYSTLFGTITGSETILDLELNSANEVIVVGTTNASAFPTTTGAMQTTYGGSIDGFLSVINSTATSIDYSTFIGGSSADKALAVAYDCEVFAAGETSSSDFPIVSGSYQTTNAGSKDAWLNKISLSAVSLSLSNPTNNSTGLNPYSTFEVSGLSSGDTWMLQISDDSNFDNVVFESTYFRTEQQINQRLESNKTYYWRARRIADGFCGDWSSAYSFTTSSLDLVYDWQWIQEADVSHEDISSICYTDENVFTFGNDCFISDDNGETWSDISSEFDDEIIDAQILSTGYGYAITVNQYFYQSTDKGLTWDKKDTGINSPIFDLCFSNNSTGMMAIDDDIYLTTNAGTSWTIVSRSTFNSAYEIKYNNGTWYVSDISLWASTNNGTSWSDISPGVASLGDVSCVATLSGDLRYIGGQNGIIYSTNAGSTWNESYIESNIDIMRIEVLNDTTAWAFSAGGNVFHTISSGEEWEETGSTMFGGLIWSLDAYDDINVWVAGESGRIAKASPKLDSTSIQTHSVILNTGWNFISTYIQPLENDIDSIFQDVENLLVVKNSSGSIYLPSAGYDFIHNFNYTEAYYVYVTAIDTLTIEGTYDYNVSPTLSLQTGWNYLPYSNDQAMAVLTALAPLYDAGLNEYDYLIIKNKQGQIVFPTAGYYFFDDLVPGEGYLIYMLKAVDLVYPKPD